VSTSTDRRRGHDRRAARERSRDVRVLKEIAEALNAAADVDQALREALAHVADLLGVKTGWIWLIDQRTGRFYSAMAQALPPFLQEPIRMTGKSCWCIDAFRSGALTAGNIDVIECSRLRAALKTERGGTRGLRFHASVPLHFGGRPLGIMNLATPEWRRLTRRELDLLSTIAWQVGVAIERARLAEEAIRLARTEERARLARDLHDTLTQGLTAIGLHIEAALRATEHGTADTRAQLERALSVARSSLDEARGSLRVLRTAPFNTRPLAEALADAGRQMASDTGIRVHVRADAEASYPPAIEEELFRIATEALTNVRRHAGAQEVEVSLAHTAGRLRLTIADDGRGFDVRRASARRPGGREGAEPGASGGFGLVGMRERALSIGGRLVVRSRAGQGTVVEVGVPLPSQPR
jgi:two-component system, NarL family, sensor kinase